MIDIKTVIYIVLALFSIGGAVVTFFTMQTRQNMKIEQLEKEIKELKERQSKATGHQITTEKDLISIGEKLDRLLLDMEDLKNKGCGACGK